MTTWDRISTASPRSVHEPEILFLETYFLGYGWFRREQFSDPTVGVWDHLWGEKTWSGWPSRGPQPGCTAERPDLNTARVVIGLIPQVGFFRWSVGRRQQPLASEARAPLLPQATAKQGDVRGVARRRLHPHPLPSSRICLGVCGSRGHSVRRTAGTGSRGPGVELRGQVNRDLCFHRF